MVLQGVKIDAVIFDMDGLILDTESMVLQSWMQVAEEFGITDIKEVFYQVIGVNVEGTKNIIMEHYGPDFPYDEYRKRARQFFQEQAKENGIPIKKGVKEVLSFLKTQNVLLGLASSTRKEIVQNELTDAGVVHYFDVIVGGDQLKKSKPAPDIYLMACEKLCVKPKHCIALEDSYNGIRSAYAAGLMPIMVPDLLQPTDEMKEKTVAILPSLLDFKGFLGMENDNTFV